MTDRPHDACHLVGQVGVHPRHLRGHDLALAFEVRIVDVEVEAAALERLGEFPGAVRGEEHQWNLEGLDRAQLGDRHLVVGEDLKQEGFGLHLDAIHLVNEKHHRFFRPYGLQQGPGQQELL